MFTNIMKTKILLAAAVVLSSVAACFSQPPGQPAITGPLSWSDCVSMAMRNNPQLASSEDSVEASKYSYYGSHNGILPQISLSHSYSQSGTVVTPTTVIPTGATTEWEAAGSISLNIFNKSQYATIAAALASLTQAQANNRQTSAQVRLNLRTAFCQLLYAQKNIEVSQNIVNMRDVESQLVTLRYNSGTEYKGNMLEAKAELLQAQADLAQSKRDFRTDQRLLCQQLGLDEFTVITVTNTLTVQDPGQLPEHNEEALLANRPDVSLQEAVVKGSEASLSQANSSLWPTLSGNYTSNMYGPQEFPSSQSYQYGLTLKYSLFGGGLTAAYDSISSAKNNLKKSKQDLRAVRENAIASIESSWSSFKQAMDSEKVNEALLEAPRVRNEEADIHYDSGLLTYDNWEIIASARISQERQTIQAELSAQTAEAAWENALGKQLGE